MKIKLPNIILTLGLLTGFLPGCSTPGKPQLPHDHDLWVPQAGEKVITDYCARCPDGEDAPAYITTLTKVVQTPRAEGGYLVFAPEFPATGISKNWVILWKE